MNKYGKKVDAIIIAVLILVLVLALVRFLFPSLSSGGIAAAVRNNDYSLFSDELDDLSEIKGRLGTFFENTGLSFEKNFVSENSWKLILSGLGTTCFITLMSVFFGSILAFLVSMMQLTGSKLAGLISAVYIRLFQWIPAVVLLMILYYVILRKSGLTAVWVAVIGFSLNFSACVSETLYYGIRSIGRRQWDAALGLGFTENQAFFRFIFPQVLLKILPVYREEMINLLKSTSVAGFIAVQDLTRMSDIIRSRTDESFFPLITAALIYFLLSWCITMLLDRLLKKLDRRHQNRRRTDRAAIKKGGSL